MYVHLLDSGSMSNVQSKMGRMVHELTTRACAVEEIIARPVYKALQNPPLPPNPYDDTIGKRPWERAMELFRHNVTREVRAGRVEPMRVQPIYLAVDRCK